MTVDPACLRYSAGTFRLKTTYFIIRETSSVVILVVKLLLLIKPKCLFLPCRWYCEGKELENSPDIQIIQTGDQHSLVIVEAFEEDTGRYSCFASNIYGTDSTSAEIYIEGNIINCGITNSL